MFSISTFPLKVEHSSLWQAPDQFLHCSAFFPYSVFDSDVLRQLEPSSSSRSSSIHLEGPAKFDLFRTKVSNRMPLIAAVNIADLQSEVHYINQCLRGIVLGRNLLKNVVQENCSTVLHALKTASSERISSLSDDTREYQNFLIGLKTRTSTDWNILSHSVTSLVECFIS